MKPNKVPATSLVLTSIEVSSRSTPFDLTRFLYKGGAKTPQQLVASAIEGGSLGAPLIKRNELVVRAFQFIDDKLAAGGSQTTAKSQYKRLGDFFNWLDSEGRCIDLHSAQSVYLDWTDFLLFRQNIEKSLAQKSVYTAGRVVGQILDNVLKRESPIIELSRIKEPKRRNSAQGINAEKQLLAETFAFGHLLQDICDGTPISVIKGPRPLPLRLRNGSELTLPGGIKKKDGRHSTQDLKSEIRRRKKIELRLSLYEADKSLASRAKLINLRILAELLMFIGQTGMNLTQAHNLGFKKFSYSSHIDGYEVREYKSRRAGEILFEIFKEYRSHFERYLAWRRGFFPAETRLFPIIRNEGVLEHSRPYFGLIQNACKQAGVKWQPPRTVRNTRVNWLLRQSGDPDLTAEIAQHNQQVLLEVYNKPSMQRSVAEIPRFWDKADPALLKKRAVLAVGPGKCDGIPSVLPSKPTAAPEPDCVRPSGCLWCEHHRDIDSLDYIWALASMRHLKTIELSKYRPPSAKNYSDHPSNLSIIRINEKLSSFENSSDIRRDFVEEALARVNEGRFHPDWEMLIASIEGLES